MNENWTNSEFVINLCRCSLFELRRFHHKNRGLSGEEKKINIIKFIQEGKQGDEMKQIIPGLWLGAHSDTLDRRQLKCNKIGYVLNASEKRRSSFGLLGENKRYENNDFKYFHIDLSDPNGSPLEGKLEKSFEFIKEALQEKNNILVHCQSGVSRSATLVIAYLMWQENMSCDEALGVVQGQCSQVQPSLGFAVFLRDFNWALNVARNEGKTIDLACVQELILLLNTKPLSPVNIDDTNQHKPMFSHYPSMKKNLLPSLKI